jgi:hypothetical protein
MALVHSNPHVDAFNGQACGTSGGKESIIQQFELVSGHHRAVGLPQEHVRTRRIWASKVHRAGSSALGWASNSKQILRSLDRLEDCSKECFDRRPPSRGLTALPTVAGPACCTHSREIPADLGESSSCSPCDRIEDGHFEH